MSTDAQSQSIPLRHKQWQYWKKIAYIIVLLLFAFNTEAYIRGTVASMDPWRSAANSQGVAEILY